MREPYKKKRVRERVSLSVSTSPGSGWESSASCSTESVARDRLRGTSGLHYTFRNTTRYAALCNWHNGWPIYLSKKILEMYNSKIVNRVDVSCGSFMGRLPIYGACYATTHSCQQRPAGEQFPPLEEV